MSNLLDQPHPDFEFVDATKPARIWIGPRNYIDISDPDELAALEEALVIRLRSAAPGQRRLYYPFGPDGSAGARARIEGFLRGRRHALLQDLGDQVYSESYNQRRQAVPDTGQGIEPA